MKAQQAAYSIAGVDEEVSCRVFATFYPIQLADPTLFPP